MLKNIDVSAVDPAEARETFELLIAQILARFEIPVFFRPLITAGAAGYAETICEPGTVKTFEDIIKAMAGIYRHKALFVSAVEVTAADGETAAETQSAEPGGAAVVL